VLERHVTMGIGDWDDPDFRSAVEEVWRSTRVEAEEFDSCKAVELAQHKLRAAGYPEAVIIHTRTVDEALKGIAHWSVIRGGPRES
jgi:hypothetical protein